MKDAVATVYTLLLLSCAAVTAVLGVVIFFRINTENKAEEIPFCGVVNEGPYYPYHAVDEALLVKHQFGQTLFSNNCSVCHDIDLTIVGPPLAGIEERREKEWLYKFIQNPMAMVESGDSTATALYEEYNRTSMPAFSLSKSEIDSLLAYIRIYSQAEMIYPAVP